MKIQVFAALKDYFDSEFIINENIKDIASLRTYLAQQKQEAAHLLSHCRFAVKNEFTDLNYPLNANDTIFIIPPSSGG